MRKFVFVWIQLFVIARIFGQNPETDSVTRLLNQPNIHDTTRAQAYIVLSELLYPYNLDTVEPLCLKARSIAESTLTKKTNAKVKHALLKSIVDAVNNIGYVYENKGEPARALTCYLKAVSISEELGEKSQLSIALQNAGFVYRNLGNIPKAIEYSHKSLTICREIGDKNGESSVLNNLAMIYNDQGDHKKALETYFTCISIYEKGDDKTMLATFYLNIGSQYDILKDYKKSLEYTGKSLEIYEQYKDKSGIIIATHNIANVYSKMGDLPSAIKYLEYSLQLNKGFGSKTYEQMSLDKLGKIYFAKGDHKKARRYAENSMRIANELGYPENIKNAAYLMFEISEKEGNYKDALKYFGLYVGMRDSIANQENKKASIHQQFRFEYEKKETEIKAASKAEKERIEAIAKKEKEKQQLIIFGIGLVLLLVATFAFLIFNRFKLTQKQKKIIEIKEQETREQKHLVEEKNKEITDSISYAKRLQEAILPPQTYIDKYIPGNFVLYKPKDIVAGDFYWAEAIEDLFFIAAADSTGHGVPGAMVSVVCSNALNRAVNEFGLIETGKILDKTRELVLETFAKSSSDVKDGMDISLCSIHTKTKEVYWSGANNPLWYIQNSEVKEIKAHKQPIGKTDNPTAFPSHKVDARPGDTLYLITDGYADQFGGPGAHPNDGSVGRGKKFKYKQLENLLLTISTKDMTVQKNALEEAFENWKGDLEQVDDVTIVGILL
ncbi:MAG TPA: tetratricopeptide repeat protein [Bacteroidia bacterium]